ncbi:MAG: hypothetical protein H6686_08220 [Fibrobacteria bacterium]|nr:hypothetical protein [Fibrobacteria bacterium]
MHKSSLYLAAALLTAPATRADAPLPQALPLGDSIPTQPGPTVWQAALASLVVPGAGQWMNGHPVRGSILGTMELWMYGDALQRNLSGIPRLREDRDAILVSLMETRSRLTGDTTLASREILLQLGDSLSTASGNANISTDYVHSEIAWALGVHAWGVVDAAEDAWIRRGGTRPVRTMAQAAWASALLPGLGQILNGRYSKAALLYMGIGGSVVSLAGRQSMVEFWKTESDLALAEGRSTRIPAEQADFFRKRRNQYIWGLGLLYVYQILDATVDARLARMEETSTLSLAPVFDRPGLRATLRF